MEPPAATIRWVITAGLLAFVAGCGNSGPDPYILANWKAGQESDYAVASLAPQKGPNGKPTLSICYSKASNSIEQIRRLVTANCSNPLLMQNQMDLYACSVGSPTRATFSCDGLSREASEVRPNLAPTTAFTGTFNLY
jgi:hypothetical protein